MSRAKELRRGPCSPANLESLSVGVGKGELEMTVAVKLAGIQVGDGARQQRPNCASKPQP